MQCLSQQAFSFQLTLVSASLSGLALPTNRLQTSMWSVSKVFGMRCNVTSQSRSRPAIVSLPNMGTLNIQQGSALRIRNISLRKTKKIRSKAMRTEAPSFQARSTCTSLAALEPTTASLLQITTTGRSSTPARHSLVGSKFLKLRGF